MHIVDLLIFHYFLQLMSEGLAWKSAAKSNEKLVYQKYAILFLSWMSFNDLKNLGQMRQEGSKNDFISKNGEKIAAINWQHQVNQFLESEENSWNYSKKCQIEIGNKKFNSRDNLFTWLDLLDFATFLFSTFSLIWHNFLFFGNFWVDRWQIGNCCQMRQKVGLSCLKIIDSKRKKQMVLFLISLKWS